MADAILCPRCEGQKYDAGACGVCDNIGFLSEAGEPIERGNCPECAGAGGRPSRLVGMGISDEAYAAFVPEWLSCRVCHGGGTLAPVQLAIYKARGGAAPLQLRGDA